MLFRSIKWRKADEKSGTWSKFYIVISHVPHFQEKRKRVEQLGSISYYGKPEEPMPSHKSHMSGLICEKDNLKLTLNYKISMS